MGIVTLYPDATYFEYGQGVDAAGRTLTGAANDYTALDASDTSFLTTVAGAGGVSAAYYHFPSPAIPAGSRIVGVRYTVRQSNTAGNSWWLAMSVGWRNPANGVKTLKTFWNPADSGVLPVDGVLYDYVGPWLPTADNGKTWSTITPTGTDFVVLMMSYLKTYPPGFDANAKVSMLRLELEYNEKPVVTVSAPSGTVINTRPTVTWTMTDPENDPQVKRWVRVYDSATYGLAGFNPGSLYRAAFDTLVQASSQPTVQITKDLLNGTTYKAYVSVWQPDINGELFASDFAASPAFTITLDPPATPDLISSLDYPNGRVALALQDRQNLMSANQADLETSALGWTSVSNATSSRITSTFAHGVASLQIQSNAAGNSWASTPVGTSGLAVVGSKQYTAMALVRQVSATARNCRIDINWYDAAGALLSTSSGASTLVNTTNWSQQLSVTATSPVGAAWANVQLNVLATAAAGEQFAFDSIGLRPGSSATWFQGGFNNATETLTVERSLDGGTTWAEIRLSPFVDPAVDETATLYDYEVLPYSTVQYRARASNVVSGNNLASAWSAVDSETYNPQAWWLKDPIDPTRNRAVQIKDFRIRRPKPNVKGFPVGQTTITMSHDGVKGAVIDCTIFSLDSTAYAALSTLMESGRTLLLQDVLGRQWFVQPDDDIQWTMLRAVKLPGDLTPVRHAHELGVTLIEVGYP